MMNRTSTRPHRESPPESAPGFAARDTLFEVRRHHTIDQLDKHRFASPFRLHRHNSTVEVGLTQLQLIHTRCLGKMFTPCPPTMHGSHTFLLLTSFSLSPPSPHLPLSSERRFVRGTALAECPDEEDSQTPAQPGWGSELELDGVPVPWPTTPEGVQIHSPRPPSSHVAAPTCPGMVHEQP